MKVEDPINVGDRVTRWLKTRYCPKKKESGDEP